MDREFVFDPKILISKPYVDCPKCRDKNTFGVLSINRQSYIRRCKKCWYDQSFPLPLLNKKIIYLDQFAISEMMKFLNHRTKANQKGNINEFWGVLFSKLDRLCKLQLIVCPNSSFHRDESVMSPFYNPLKRIYELLSCDVKFEDDFSIKKHQIYLHAQEWLQGKNIINLNIDDIIDGDVHGWTDRFIISVNYPVEKLKDELTLSKRQAHGKFLDSFKIWQQEKDKSFDYWFNKECTSIGPYFLGNYIQDVRRIQSILNGEREFRSYDDIEPTESYEVVRNVINVFEKAGKKGDELAKLTTDYFFSSDWQYIPFVRISALLLAALARRAAAGQKKLPNEGMIYDFNIISVLLPYCDAMFIDNECRSLLVENELVQELQKYGTKTFSYKNKDEFIQYLDEIEKNASASHIAKVEEVYGEGHVNPYMTIFKNIE